MATVDEFLLERLRELVAQGRLTGQAMALDNEPLNNGEQLPEEESMYRKDGYTHETSHGCRRHRLIDDAIAEMKRGNQFEKQVAEEADIWFGFDPEHAPDMNPDNDDELKDLSRAFFNSRIMIRWLGGPGDVSTDFRLEDEDREVGEPFWFMPKKHAIVYADNPQSEAPSRWPEHYVRGLASRAKKLEQQVGLDWK